MKAPTAATRLVALLGSPVAHSLSPRMHNAAFRAAGVDAVYCALECDAAAFAGLLRGIAGAGGAGNVTVPHKRRAAALLDRRTDAVRATGACNTFWADDSEIVGDNTDVAGVRAAVRTLTGDPAGASVLLLGAGGAARAVLYALLDDGADHVSIHNRTTERARELSAAFDSDRDRIRVIAGRDELAGTSFDLVMNATALGLDASDRLPLDLSRLAGAPTGVLDLVYGADETPWIRHARGLGIAAADGREMLVRQGAAAFERWCGAPAPVPVMRDALGLESDAGRADRRTSFR